MRIVLDAQNEAEWPCVEVAIDSKWRMILRREISEGHPKRDPMMKYCTTDRFCCGVRNGYSFWPSLKIYLSSLINIENHQMEAMVPLYRCECGKRASGVEKVPRGDLVCLCTLIVDICRSLEPMFLFVFFIHGQTYLEQMSFVVAAIPG
ncbi:hypothetical protein TNCV_3754551 [Trichonephila clavipes]|nr:hypothetical protein TNCV_3754551 [Trichonephila clavipes]